MSGDGNELVHVIPQSYGDSLPTASGFSAILQPGQPCTFNHNSQGYTAPVPYELAAAHLNSVYTAGLHPTHQMLMHNNSHFMEQIHANQPLSLPQTTGHLQSIKQEPGLIPGGPPFIKQEPGLIPGGLAFIPGGPPFIKQEPGLHFIRQEPGGAGGSRFIDQEPRIIPGGHSFIKQEPSGGPSFIKQEPGLIERESSELSLEKPTYSSGSGGYCRNGAFIKQEQGAVCKPEVEVNACHYKSVKQEVALAGLEFGAAFPSQPLDFNFMADIEDIIQPDCEISIDCIQRELSNFEGPSASQRNRIKVVKEVEEASAWEPPLWKQQYENIRTMRSKRDAPVDKYGCFMNAEKGVAPEVRRYQLLVSLMLSSQTKDEVVGKAMTKLKENGLTISSVLGTPQEEIARMIFPVGFWNKKSEYIKKTTEILEKKFSNDIPNSVEGLVSLPGIGPKMAHLIMDFAWGEVSGIAVDTHVHRITHRLGWMKKEARNPEEARKQLEKWFPRSEWSDLNLLCVGFGQQICCPVGPKCSECSNKDLCPSSSCLVSSGLPLGIGFEVSTKSKRKKATAKSNSVSAVKTKKIKIEK